MMHGPSASAPAGTANSAWLTCWRIARDDVGAAALVFDDSLLAPFFRQPLAERSRHGVGDAAGCGGDHNGDRAGWVGLRMSLWREQAGKRKRNAEPP